jgi:hypothetical protein
MRLLVTLALAACSSVPAAASFSESCARESMALVGQRALQDAADRVEVDCQPSTSASGSISYNYDGCPAKDSFLAACSAAGGKTLFYNVDISCSQGIRIVATNVPECVGASCGEDGLATKNDRVFSSLEQQLKGSNFVCSVTGGSTVREPSPPAGAVPTISMPETENTISLDDDDSSGAVACMISVSAITVGLVSVLFSLV